MISVRLLVLRGHNLEAIEVLLPELRKAATPPLAVALAHELLFKLGRKAEARALVDAGLRLASQDPDLLWSKAEQLADAGDRAGAERTSRRACELRPADQRRQNDFLLLLYGSGKTLEAIRHLDIMGKRALKTDLEPSPAPSPTVGAGPR